jgi:hypothetical protein
VTNFLIQPNGKWTSSFSRDPTKDINLTLNLETGKAATEADNVQIPATPVLAPQQASDPNLSSIVSNTNNTGNTYQFQFSSQVSNDAIVLQLTKLSAGADTGGCALLEGSLGNGFFLSPNHPRALIPEPGCLVWVRGVLTVVDNPTWSTGYVRFYGTISAADKYDQQSFGNEGCTNVDQYVAALPTHFPSPTAGTPIDFGLYQSFGTRCPAHAGG